MKKKIIVTIIFLLFSTFSIGLLIGNYKTISINFLQNDTSDDKFFYQSDSIPFQINEDDIKSMIQINNTSDISTKRNSLIELIWNGNGFPHSLPNIINTNIHHERYNDLDNIRQVDELIINMDYDINSVVYLFHPQKSNNKLVIYHQGHDGDFLNGKNTIQFFLQKGYSVLALSMPLNGMNSQPIITLNNHEKMIFFSHNQFILLESPNFSPIKYFVEPIAISLNYLDKNYNFDSYYMVGISGGGWTTVLYSAIDERISQSYSVAGSYPLYLRYEQKNIGDYEQ